MNELTSTLIENKIYTIRSKQIMLDSDLAEMYQVETKVFNQAVKRNIDRFPISFRFQLNEQEYSILRSQFVTSSEQHGGRRYFPYAFTEQGVAMLSAVLRSNVAVRVSIRIMQAFVQMRQTLGSHHQLLQISHELYQHKLETKENFEKVFKALETPEIIERQGVFFDGQIFDAHILVSDIIRMAKKQIVIIDNYVDDTVLTLLSKKQAGVSCIVLTKRITKQIELDAQKFNEQYGHLKILLFGKAHDRFLIIDQNDVYHIGASLKDLGKKWFAFSKMEAASLTVIQSIKELIGEKAGF